MNLNRHSELIGKHAFLSPSKYTWLGYSKDQLRQAYINANAAARGTKLHAIAKELIEEGIKVRGNKQTFAAYVNDAIGYGMTPEQPLYFSDNCFGTTDALYYKNGILRIHDYKSGTTPAHMEQLEIYAALFCLEYKMQPKDIGMELRIYQNNEILIHSPLGDDIKRIMQTIIVFDGKIEKIRVEE